MLEIATYLLIRFLDFLIFALIFALYLMVQENFKASFNWQNCVWSRKVQYSIKFIDNVVFSTQ